MDVQLKELIDKIKNDGRKNRKEAAGRLYGRPVEISS